MIARHGIVDKKRKKHHNKEYILCIFTGEGDRVRKIFAALLGVLFAVCAAQTARAEEYTTYYLEEYGLVMEIDVPSEYVVITQDTPEDDPCFAEMGTTAEEQFAYMEENDVYMQLVDLERFFIIGITLQEGGSEDFGTFSDEDFSLLVDYFNEMADQSGMEKYTFKEYVCDSIRYLASAFEVEFDGIRSYRRQYYTVYNGVEINVMLMAYSPENMEENAEILKEIIDRIRISVPGSAPEGYTKYYLDELEMEISLPEEVYAVTRENVEENPFLDIFGLSPDQALEILEAENLYLSAVDEEVSFQLMLSVTEVPGLDFREYSDDELKNFLDIKRENYIDIGGTWIGGSVLQLEETSFLKIDFLWNDGKKDIRVQEHYTIYQGKAFNLTLNSYTGSISDEMESMLVQTVGSIRFDTDSQLQEPEPKPEPESVPESETPSPAATYEYRDELSDSVFAIPGNWSQEQFESEFNGVKFSPGGDSGVFLLLHSVDVYTETLREYEQDGDKSPFDTRAEYDLLFSNEECAARVMQCEANEVDSAVYGGNTYFCAARTVSLEVLGITVDQPVMYFVHIENGFVYLFQLYGEKDSAFFRDFETLLGSAQYTHADAQDVADAREDALWSQFSPMNLLAGLVMTVTIYSLPIFIYRWGIRRYPVEKKKARNITIWYAVFSFVAMIAVTTFVNGKGSASAIWLWSWVNYKVLVGGEDKRRRAVAAECDPWERPEQETAEIPESEPVSESPVAEIPSEENEEKSEDAVRFCNSCGFELHPGSEYCGRCGKPIYKEK